MWQWIEDDILMFLAKNKQKFLQEMGRNMVVFGTQLNTAGVSYTLVPCLQLLLCSLKYVHEEMVEIQQIKELSGEHKIMV